MKQLLLRNVAGKKKGLDSGARTAFLNWLNPQPPEGYEYKGTYNGREMFTDGNGSYFCAKALFAVGDIVYIREDYTVGTNENGEHYFLYKADGDAPPKTQWKAATHMPIEAVRYFMEVTRTEIVRFNDMSKETAKAIAGTGRTPQQQVREEWDGELRKKLAHMRSELNPWMQVVHFRLVPRPAEAKEGISDEIARIGSGFRHYTIRKKDTGEIIAQGSALECAEMLGYTRRTAFYGLIDRIRQGRNKTFTMEIKEPD